MNAATNFNPTVKFPPKLIQSEQQLETATARLLEL